MITLDDIEAIKIEEYVEDKTLFEDVRSSIYTMIEIAKKINKKTPNILTKDPDSYKESDLVSNMTKINIGYDIDSGKFKSKIDSKNKYSSVIEVAFGDCKKSKMGKLFAKIVNEDLPRKDQDDLFELVYASYKKRVMNLYKKKTKLLLSNDTSLEDIYKLLSSEKIIIDDIGDVLAISSAYYMYERAGIKSTIDNRKNYLLKLVSECDLDAFKIVRIINMSEYFQDKNDPYSKFKRAISFMNICSLTKHSQEVYELLYESQLTNELISLDIFNFTHRLIYLNEHNISINKLKDLINLYYNNHKIYFMDQVYESCDRLLSVNQTIYLLLFEKALLERTNKNDNN